MITHPDALDQIAERLSALERRVTFLEHCPPSVETTADLPVVLANPTAVKAESSQIGGALTVVGKALLGIAGAYVLRAMSGSGVMPRFLVAAIAVTYALGWLLAAARTVSQHKLAGVLYAVTSALILAPMLWEMTLRFDVLPAWAAAAVLAAFGCVATGLAWRPGRSPVFSVAYMGCALTALALLIGTHDIAPFAAILLAMLVVCEFGSAFHRSPAIRVLVALAADLAVWILLFIYRASSETRTDYPALSAGRILMAPLLLFAIQAASVAIYTGASARRISIFEATQAVIALLLASCGIAWFLPGPSEPILGTLYLALSAICYGAAFVRFRHAADPRNFHIFTAWGGALLIAGLYLAASRSASSVLFGCAAVAAILLSRKLQSAALAVHGVLFLAISAVLSALIPYAFKALAGQMPPLPAWEIVLAAACAAVAYLAAGEAPEKSWTKQFVPLVPAFLAVCAVAAFLTRAGVGLAGLVLTPDVFHIALVRTLILSCIALALAFGGARLHRAQMTHIAWAATAFVTAKLLFEDLRHGHMEFIAASICLVAVTLIAVPRLSRS